MNGWRRRNRLQSRRLKRKSREMEWNYNTYLFESELCIKVTLNPRKRSNYADLGKMHSGTQVTLTQL